MPQHATTCHNMPQPANMPPEMPPEKAQVQIDIIRGRGRGETPRITTFQFFMGLLSAIFDLCTCVDPGGAAVVRVRHLAEEEVRRGGLVEELPQHQREGALPQ
eukprot:2530025-Pyramimonas_sp.AAC.1